MLRPSYYDTASKEWIFQRAITKLTEQESQVWTWCSLLEGPSPKKTDQVLEDLSDFYPGGYSYRTVSRALSYLVTKDLAERVRQGYYKAKITDEVLMAMGQALIDQWRRTR